MAGPTPRTPEEEPFNWRKQIIKSLSTADAPVHLFVPEFYGDDKSEFSKYSDFPKWELDATERCDIIAFWVPRQKEMMNGYTTKVEFGYTLAKYKDKVYYGRPDSAYKIRYLDYLYKKECKCDPVIYNNIIEFTSKLIKLGKY